MLRSDHSAFFGSRGAALGLPLWCTPSWLLGLAALAFASGCTPKIGDKCTVSTDCSATGDRLCDITEPGGYCTIFNCEPDDCPDDAACINFGTALSVGNIPGCTVSQGDSPYQRSFCMASCETDGDCRGGYRCIEPADVGGVKVDRNRSNKVCAVPRSATDPTLVLYKDAGTDGGNNEVCLGAVDASADASSRGGASSSTDAGSAGASSSGGSSGAGNAGAADAGAGG
jgi:hypothetical protein